MPIVQADLLWKLSTKSGSAGDSTAQADPNASLGKYVSTTQAADGVLNGLFDVITGQENADSEVDYRCVFFHNNHASLDLTAAKLWLSAEIAGGAVAAIGLDPAGAVPKGQASAQAAEIATETDAPSGVSFSSPTTKATGLDIGTLAAGEVIGVWIRRSAQDTGAVNSDGATLQVEGDTPA